MENNFEQEVVTTPPEKLAPRPALTDAELKVVNEWMFSFKAFLTKLKQGTIVYGEPDISRCEEVIIYYPVEEAAHRFWAFICNHLINYSDAHVRYVGINDNNRHLFNYSSDGTKLNIYLQGFERDECKDFQTIDWEKRYGGYIKCKYEFI